MGEDPRQHDGVQDVVDQLLDDRRVPQKVRRRVDDVQDQHESAEEARTGAVAAAEQDRDDDPRVEHDEGARGDPVGDALLLERREEVVGERVQEEQQPEPDEPSALNAPVGDRAATRDDEPADAAHVLEDFGWEEARAPRDDGHGSRPRPLARRVGQRSRGVHARGPVRRR